MEVKNMQQEKINDIGSSFVTNQENGVTLDKYKKPFFLTSVIVATILGIFIIVTLLPIVYKQYDIWNESTGQVEWIYRNLTLFQLAQTITLFNYIYIPFYCLSSISIVFSFLFSLNLSFKYFSKYSIKLFTVFIILAVASLTLGLIGIGNAISASSFPY